MEHPSSLPLLIESEFNLKQHGYDEPFCSTSRNELVSRLSAASQCRLLEKCETVSLSKGQVLYDRGTPLGYAYFIESGGCSVTTRARDCLPVEIHTLGMKDFVGVPLVLGMHVSPHRCSVRVRGQALRIQAEQLISLIKRDVELEKMLLGYVQAILNSQFATIGLQFQAHAAPAPRALAAGRQRQARVSRGTFHA